MTLELSARAALWFLPFALPLCAYTIYTDLAFMRITNVTVIALAAVFVLIGPIALPFDSYLWHLLAMARTEGLGKARPQMIKMGRDPRRVMRTVEEAFRNGDAESIGALEAIATDGGAGDRFYASLYRGLLAEAAGQPKVSADWISRAVENKEYAASGDYMYALAKVHQSRRKK